IRSRSSSVPSTEKRRNFSQPSARMVAECRKLLMTIGRIAFSSKLPWLPANATAVSSPITWIAIITIATHWVGFTLPGMIDEPGSFCGTFSSPRPQRGPDADQRRRRPHHGIQRALGHELVGRGDEGLVGQLGNPGRDILREALRRVQAGAHGGAPQRQLVETFAGSLDIGDARPDLGGPA